MFPVIKGATQYDDDDDAVYGAAGERAEEPTSPT